MAWFLRDVQQKIRMGRTSAFVLCAALLTGTLALPASAANTWVWTDGNGRKVYSDTPPPASVSDRQILQRPGLAPPPPPPAAAPSPAAKPSGQTAPKVSPAGDPKGKTPAQSEEARRKAIETKNAEIRAENCKRARASLNTLNSGRRLVTTNEQGQQVPLTASEKAEEAARLEQIVAENCSGEAVQ
jgi:hypothetical protein